MVRRKKKEVESIVTTEIEEAKKNGKSSSEVCKQTKRRKTNSNEGFESLSELKVKPIATKNKIVNIEDESEKVVSKSKRTRQLKDVNKDVKSVVTSKIESSVNKRPNIKEKREKVVSKSKRTRQLKDVNKDAKSVVASKIESSVNKRPKRATTKKGFQNENEPKLKKAKIVLERLDIKQKNYHSENENSSGSSADSGCLLDPASKIGKHSVNVKLIKQEMPSCSNLNSSGIGDDSPSSESEWEEVEETEEQTLENYNPVIPKEGVEITIDCPNLKFKKRKKKEFDEMEWTRLYINRMRREAQLNVHKCHLLCLLSCGLSVNDIINSPLLQAIALSVIPVGILDWTKGKKVDKIDVDGIKLIVKCFRSSFSYQAKEEGFNDLFTSLAKSFETKTSLNASEYNIMFVIIARILGFKARFCMSLYPMSYKATNLIKKRKMKNKETTESSDSSIKKQVPENECKVISNVKPKIENTSAQKSKKDEISNKKLHEHSPSSKVNSDDSKNNSLNFKPKKTDVSKQKSKEKKEASIKKVQKSSSTSDTKNPRPKRSAGKNYKMSSDESAEDSDDLDFKVEKEDVFEKRKAYRKSSSKMPKQKTCRKILSDSESDTNPLPLYPCYHPDKVFYWAEIFSKPDKQWISVECFHNVINDPYEIEAVLPQPVSYVVVIDNESYVKDVTKRYCRNYMTFNIKLRVISDWWDETLVPFAPPNSKLDKEEEKKLETALINQPLPNTVGGFKNHPLYGLKRHLLKFEAIYPPDAAPVGFLRKEPIYLRENIVQLHSRETWLKEARVVRIGEEPYKIVKARPKWDRISGVLRTDLPLDIFGFWQTEPYEPPIAVDGKVPRNEYGNVELFKPCMLPRGTVHIQLPGVNRIAKKLGIDCSPAVVGFDGHKGSVHPVFEGFVVCEEYKDTILAAWDEEQENIRKREEEKREKRIYGNWKRLIKGLLIRERIKLKYDV